MKINLPCVIVSALCLLAALTPFFKNISLIVSGGFLIWEFSSIYKQFKI